jgi:hypothetical protein
MTRVNKKASPSARRRAFIRQRKRNSERVFKGETGNLRIVLNLGVWEYRTHLTRALPELMEYATYPTAGMECDSLFDLT